MLTDKEKSEYKYLRSVYATLKRKYLTPVGWSCSFETTDVILSVYSAIKSLEMKASGDK
jgi:hypothetical protein